MYSCEIFYLLSCVAFGSNSIIRRTCCITRTAEGGSRNVTKDINHENNNLISVIRGFVVAQDTAVGTKTGEALQSRAYLKTEDT
jgi:hypothetical protein